MAANDIPWLYFSGMTYLPMWIIFEKMQIKTDRKLKENILLNQLCWSGKKEKESN